MIATRHTSVAFLRHVLAVLFLTCLPMAIAPAGESADRPADDAAAKAASPPHRSHIQPVGEVAVVSRNADTLGLRLTRASEVLRQQLALSRGAGLVVEEVVAGSTAEKAGFKQHDVLVLLDDQVLLLPEQLAALLEASTGHATPQCTLLRGGAKVTIPLGNPTPTGQPATTPAPKASRQPTLAGTPTMTREPAAPTVRQTAKPSTSPRLRAPASALALVQPGTNPATGPGRSPAVADETLLRQDADYQIKLSRGGETRLVVTDTKGAVVFNGEIDTPERRSLVPAAVRQRVEEMERSMESTTQSPAVEIGRLDVSPIEIR